MNELKIHILNVDQMIHFGELLTKYMSPNLVLALTGDLGAGKTTFTKGIGKALGIKRVINSPTFTIMKVYDCENKLNNIQKLYHLDVYRLTDSSSDFELEEYFNLDGVAIIEWADIISDLLPNDTWHMIINDIGNNERMINLKINNNQIVNKLIVELKGEGYEVIS